MDDVEFVQWYGPWSPLTVDQVVDLLQAFDRVWWIVGGQAIERFTGVPRPHEDLDVVVLRSDAGLLLSLLAEAGYHAWANSSGSLTPMLDKQELPSHAGQIWIRRHALAPWEVDFGVGDERDGAWVWRHDRNVAMAVADATWVDEHGVRFARPEIVLAHKARWRQQKDDEDFDAAWPMLDRHARGWLRDNVTRMYPDHPWLDRMA